MLQAHVRRTNAVSFRNKARCPTGFATGAVHGEGMDTRSLKLHAWKAAEAELADIEKAFRAMAADLTPSDRGQVVAQLAALKMARLRVRLLFEELMNESELTVRRLVEEEEGSAPAPVQPQDPAGRDHWLL